VFGLAYKTIYETVGSVLPNHPGYVQLPALLIIVFGIGFWMVAQDVRGNRSIISLGILMKLAFGIVVFGHLIAGNTIPFYIPFGIIDLGFAILFLMARKSLDATSEVGDRDG